LQNRLRIGGQLFMGRSGAIGMAEPVEFHLIELVQANQATGVPAVAAGFPAEAGAVGHVTAGQVGGRQDLVSMQVGEGHLRCGAQPEVVVRTTKALLGKFGQLAGAGETGGVHQGRGQDFHIAPANMQIQHELNQSSFQARPQAQQRDEPTLGNAHGALAFKQAQGLAQLPVLQTGGSGFGVAPAAQLHVIGFATAIGATGGGQIGQVQQFIAQLPLGNPLLSLQGSHRSLDGFALLFKGFYLDMKVPGLHGGTSRTGARASGGAELGWLPCFLVLPDPLTHQRAHLFSFGLQLSALLRQLLHPLGMVMERVNIHHKTTTGQLRRHMGRVLANKAWVKHSGGPWALSG